MEQTYTRKATFKLNNGVYQPVNKRAKTVAKSLGRRTKITKEELMSSVGKGSYTFWAYTGKTNTLKAIKF